MKKKVLFLCAHNSARSQMAEGFMKRLFPDRFEACSAGIQPTVVNPYAVEVMKEIGIDISEHRSKNVAEFQAREFDYVVTVCDDAREACPFFPGKKIIHKGFPDPAAVGGSEEGKLDAFRQVRSEIRDWLVRFFGEEKSAIH